MSLNGILSGALTSLQANSTALRVVSENISNLNTANYARREVQLSTLGSAGIPTGVTVEDVRRVSDQYLTQETLSATASAATYDTQSSINSQIGALLGSPGDGTSLSSRLSDVFTKLSAAALSTNSSTSQSSVVSSMKSLASSISSLSSSLDSLSTQVDSQLSTSVTTANGLIKQIYDYNNLISSSQLQGNTDSTYIDQRATALASLAEQMDIRVTEQGDGSVLVTTQDGINLVSDSYATLSYTPSQSGSFNSIMVQDTNGSTGKAIGTAQTLDSHLTGGTMSGLIEARDTTIAGLKSELGSFAASVADAFNEISNASSAYPPPTTLNGHNTGLVSTDSLNFSGQTSIVLTDSSGVSQHQVDIDFDAGTISVDGSASSGFSNDVDSFVTALNSALSSVGGSASFTNGSLDLSGGTSGLVVTDPDSSNASSRAGTGFSQFFGLNDIFTTSVPTIANTGVTGSDDAGLTDDGEIDLVLKDANGAVAKTVSVSLTAGMTFDQAITAINTALGGAATLSLDSSTGAVSTTTASKYSGYSLQVASDSTLRDTTGISLTSFFGIGSNTRAQAASGFAVNADILSDNSRIPFAEPDLTTTSGQVVGSGDTSGLQALQALATAKQSFVKAGNLSAQTVSLQNYAASIYQDFSTRSAAVETNKTTQDDRLTEAQSRLSDNSGVNLDEELSNMIIYQQAYSASARLMTTVNDLYDTLLNIQ